MVDKTTDPPRKCGGHCPGENIKDSTNTKCRICKKVYHLPCYDVIAPPSRLFVTPNIVFVCDSCLDEMDNPNSPKRKQAGQTLLKQSLLTSTGSVMSQSNAPINERNDKAKKTTNEQLYALLTTMAKKLDKQTCKIDEISTNVGAVGIGIMETQKKSDDVYNIVYSRLMLREQQDLRDLAKEVFNSKQNETAETFGENKERVYPQLNTPKNKTTKTNTPKQKLYSTVLQSKLPVTPQTDTPSQRKREKHILLIDNSSSTTVESVKIPTPKQGKKNVQIGRPVEERQSVSRKVNPLSESIWISKFHPETTPEELENYIIEHTGVNDKSKFKCVKLVKKDSDITKLSYVSFKIDATPEVYDILNDPENWPSDKQIRPFVKITPPKRTLNDFVPQKSNPTNTVPEDVEKMDATETSNQSTGGIDNNVIIGNENKNSPSKNV